MNKKNVSSYDSILKNFENLDLNKTSVPKDLTSDNLPSNKPRSKHSFTCTVCNVHSSSSLDFENHMNGKRHFENVRFNNSIQVENSPASRTNYGSQSVTDEFEVASIKF